MTRSKNIKTPICEVVTMPESTFAELVVPHNGCYVLGMGKDNLNHIMDSWFVPREGWRKRTKWYEIGIWAELEWGENIVDTLNNGNGGKTRASGFPENGHYRIFCNMEDVMLDTIFSMGKKSKESISIYDYRILKDYDFLQGPAEYICVSLPDIRYFTETILGEIIDVSAGKTIDWRILKNEERKMMKGFSLYQNFLIDNAKKMGYFKKPDKKLLTPFMEEYNLENGDIDKLKDEIDTLSKRVVGSFLSEFEQPHYKE